MRNEPVNVNQDVFDVYQRHINQKIDPDWSAFRQEMMELGYTASEIELMCYEFRRGAELGDM